MYEIHYRFKSRSHLESHSAITRIALYFCGFHCDFKMRQISQQADRLANNIGWY